ncbi:treacle protein isoform X4 [Cyrtonyx montezumae]|uniref:treacle protein isoform X4 n=1 Tax=Cyrtonyx montezumae TaxID=9017 RepID=UPI0032DAE9A6
MAAGDCGRRELLALIHQHLLRSGYSRAARELQAQLGQKLLPSLATSLEEIFTHWEKTPSKTRRRKLSDEEAAIPEKIRVPDPVSSSESSEKEEDEKEKTKTGNATSLSPVTNSAVNVDSSEDDDDSSSEEETPSGKGAITVTPAVVSGKAANSLHSPVRPTAPGSKVAVPSAANRTVLSNKQQPNASGVASAKAGQKLPGPGKPGQAVSQAGQSKAPVMTKAAESSSSSSSSSSSESEDEKETPTVKAPVPKVELKQATGAAESSSEDSSDETSSEEDLVATSVQAKPAVTAVQVNSAPVRSAPPTPVSTKKSTVKQRAVTPNQAKHGSVTVPVAAKPDDSSESSDSSDSGNEEPPSVIQTKLSSKTSQAMPSPVRTTPAACLSSKAAPAKTLPLSQGKPALKPTVLKQAKATPGRTAAPAKPAESTNPAESTDSSGSEEDDLPMPVSQKRLPEQPGPVPSLSQAAKAAAPEKAVENTLKNETSESGSSDSSDSEEETQPALPAAKSNAMPQPTSVKKVPAPTPAPAPLLHMDSSDDSSEESDSDEEVVPPTQTLSQQNIKPTKASSTVAAKANATPPSGKGIKAPPIPPISRVSESSNSDSSESSAVVGEVKMEEAVPPACLKQTAPTGKAPSASPAAPQAASILRSATAKLKKPGPHPAQDARLSQTAPLTQAESSDSSSSYDSDKETPKQPPKPGMLQKPGGTEPDDSSSSDSSEDEEAVSQSLLAGYLSLSKSPAAPQAPKTVPLQPAGNAGQGKAASSLAKVPVKAAPADSSSSDSSDSDTDVELVSANHKADNKPSPGQEATGASNKVAGKIDASHANPKPSPVKKALAVKENDVEAKGTQGTPLPSVLLSTPQPAEPSLGSKREVTTAAGVPAVQTPGLEEKKKKKKEKKEKKEKKKSSTADKAVKTSKGKDKENKKQKASQKRKRPGEDGAVGQPKEKKRKGQANEEVPKKKKKKAANDPEKLPGSKEKKKSSKKVIVDFSFPEKKSGKEKKNKKMPTEGEPTADGSAEVHKKKKKKKTAELEGLL